ncbi:hypothetical protein [Billgrantia ethanolica]|uniref:Uncharacterized protein n=1 Tax=Billgrantia ethanolica TaxID=2733486 RepID=A0ABS9A6Q1_9GAMM|nr:hypothetical protein [Halomonas ethanolica]MCE8004013.1 hypothetical protein [Halomonas ethanolica]
MMTRFGTVLFLLGLGVAIVMIFPLVTALLMTAFTGLEPTYWGHFFSGSLFFLAIAGLALAAGGGARRVLVRH